jgi:hypothetical protein
MVGHQIYERWKPQFELYKYAGINSERVNNLVTITIMLLLLTSLTPDFNIFQRIDLK